MKKIILFLSCFIFGIFSIFQVANVFAEKVGSSPESGATSRLKTLNDDLVSLGIGNTAAGAWGDWGEMWNRIYSSASFIPSGTVSVSDVNVGKTFYSDSRIKQTGIGSTAQDWLQQSLVKRDDIYVGDETGEEASWTNTVNVGVGSTLNVWKDNRTGLYWSTSRGLSTNNFTIASCDFFTTVPRGSYGGGDADCGNAINACANLSLEAVTGQGAKNDWYLPSQKEILQAYIDGMYNQTNDTIPTAINFWTTTEYWNGSLVYTIHTAHGYSFLFGKTATSEFRCVRRD